MSPIVIAVIAVAVIGLVCALVLCVAAILFAVPVDEKAEKIRECLPGANCGACGFSGCDGYAAALSQGKTDNTALCIPGGNDVSAQIAEITGGASGTIEPMTAVVLCCGNSVNTELKLEYQGVKTCKMAQQLFGGPKSCTYGCIGFGDCVKACPYDAIFLCDGIARVNPTLCRACKTCVAVCPKGLIEMLPLTSAPAAVLCKNKDKGGQTRKQCKAGCIGCMRCVKACEFGAVTVKDNVAHVDYDKCTGCGKCTSVCPSKCITIVKLHNPLTDGIDIASARVDGTNSNTAQAEAQPKKPAQEAESKTPVSAAVEVQQGSEPIAEPKKTATSETDAKVTEKAAVSTTETTTANATANQTATKPQSNSEAQAAEDVQANTEAQPTSQDSEADAKSNKTAGSAVSDTKAALKKQK